MKVKDSDNVVTNKVLYEAVDAILHGMDSMAKDSQKAFKKIEEQFEKIDQRFDKLDDKIDNTALDTPSRREFEALKSKVNKLSLQ